MSRAELASTRPLPFPERGHLSAIGLRLHLEQETAVLRWARWAKDQVEQWDSTSDPGGWDSADVLAAIARSADR